MILDKALRQLPKMVPSLADMKPSTKSEFIDQSKRLADDEVLNWHIERELDEIKIKLQRHTRGEEEIQFLRGRLYSLERLRKNLKQPVPKIVKSSFNK